ncbi:hypothetical protein OIO90_001470 [Microbotryomycetes sp. JL221]|nr:hypothetical protein OIO90_001470 [Microbotryomycetes sp. JL221]
MQNSIRSHDQGRTDAQFLLSDVTHGQTVKSIPYSPSLPSLRHLAPHHDQTHGAHHDPFLFPHRSFQDLRAHNAYMTWPMPASQYQLPPKQYPQTFGLTPGFFSPGYGMFPPTPTMVGPLYLPPVMLPTMPMSMSGTMGSDMLTLASPPVFVPFHGQLAAPPCNIAPVASNWPMTPPDSGRLTELPLYIEPVPQYSSSPGSHHVVDEKSVTQKQLSTPTVDILNLGDLRLCSVEGCLSKVVCQLSPCECHLCREHLGQTIRGVKVIVDNTEEHDAVNGQSRSTASTKVYTCRACSVESKLVGGPVARTSTHATIDNDEQTGKLKNKNAFGLGLVIPAAVDAVSLKTTADLTYAPPPSEFTTPDESVVLHQLASPAALATIPRPSSPLTSKFQSMLGPVESVECLTGSFVPELQVLENPTLPSSASTPDGFLSRQSLFDSRGLLSSYASTTSLCSIPEQFTRGQTLTCPGVVTSVEPLIPPSPLALPGPLDIVNVTQPILQLDNGEPVHFDRNMLLEIENIRYGVRTFEILDWLAPARLFTQVECPIRIHIVVHRCVPSDRVDLAQYQSGQTDQIFELSATLRSLPRCYVEGLSVQEMQHIMHVTSNTSMGDRTLFLNIATSHNLMLDLFDQRGIIGRVGTEECGTRQKAAGLNRVTAKHVEKRKTEMLDHDIGHDALVVRPSTYRRDDHLFWRRQARVINHKRAHMAGARPELPSEEELSLLFDSCRRMRRMTVQCPKERAFLNLALMIEKFPWHEQDLWTTDQRDNLFRTASDAITVALTKAEFDKDYLHFAQTLID